MSLITEDIRSKASEIYYDNEICKANVQRLMREMGLPIGILPVEDLLECGYVKETGFVWMKQKKETKHKFEKIGSMVSCATEITAYIEPCKITKVKGIKAKEILVWLTVTEATMDSPKSDKIVFKTTTGLYRTFPTDAFVIEEEPVKKIEAKCGGALKVGVANMAWW